MRYGLDKGRRSHLAGERRQQGHFGKEPDQGAEDRQRSGDQSLSRCHSGFFNMGTSH